MVPNPMDRRELGQAWETQKGESYKGEALHRDYVEPRVQRKIGWMFWGSISGLGKGLDIFWGIDN